MEIIEVIPTISNGVAYASGDQIGGLLTFSGFKFKTALIQEIKLIDIIKQNAAIDILFFNEIVTLAADNAAFVLSAGNMKKVASKASFSSYTDLGANGSISFVQNLNIPISLQGSELFYGALISRGTPTYTSTTGLIVQATLIEYEQ